ncbi:Tex family protein [Vagococcus lutrae]|uniref:Tex family protein n=1 Tax=Vagococcus lutrae TaxID=81947 RepID=UPI0020986496|nr:Tex family protein [Vagococcus lutrae]MCO7150934.1 RNA-binding transcriptional accessory protein [Vagococcus lutrae]MDT2812407.1 Tex family protein [Vagococcus lutrae]MDT2819190.1 Tex family protein [Vagococcus lutrae]MDT2844075.1 Tex family protein [Vagococcus lutrae]WCG05095.1 Tex family protein [Vagococcus lutrae]
MSEDKNQQIMNLLMQELDNRYTMKQMKTVLSLIEEGNTIPFIARYRKEMTGSLDEVAIQEILERHRFLENLETRRSEVLRLIDEQGKLTEELERDIVKATKLQQLEDLYRPYKQKRRTKATIAREKGLLPLAEWLLSLPNQAKVEAEAQKYINEEKELTTIEDVLSGAHEIMAETISDEPKYRQWLRNFAERTGVLVTEGKQVEKDEKKVYEMYYDHQEPVAKVASHRVLAMNRGEKEDILKVSVSVEEEKVMAYFDEQLIGNKTSSPAVSYVRNAYEDSYKRFIGPAIEREIRSNLTEQADQQAIDIFGENLRHLLLQSPLKKKVVMGFDPAYRTGCKLAIVDETGKVEAIDVIYPHKPASHAKRAEAATKFQELIKKYHVKMVAIGNGTASRESEKFVAENLKALEETVYYVIVNEAGASVYSASEVAREEFPDLQVEERSAVSIARRLQDPLAELVKIDPKAVGVGQYQHDVSQKQLNEQLSFVVETAVNQVGVNVNTASPQLLEHVSGLTKATAKNLVAYREENGAFSSRNEFKKVPRLGPKAFEQSVGFLRILDGKSPLDNTSIHPESYDTTKALLQRLEIDLEELGSKEATDKLEAISVKKLAKELEVGEQTLEDIVEALKQPGRDLREDMPAPLLRQDVLEMKDLLVGMELEGTVRNVVDFGAFVDIGVKQDGLVHLSKMSTKFVKHPRDIVSVGDVVTVWVEKVELDKQRISLTMKQPKDSAQ